MTLTSFDSLFIQEVAHLGVVGRKRTSRRRSREAPQEVEEVTRTPRV